MPDHLVRSKLSKPPKVLRPTGNPRKKAAVRKPAAPEAHAKADGYIPFRERFRAWWHGVEPAAVVKKGQKAKTTCTKRLIELDDKEDLPPQADWCSARTRVCDQIWGPGRFVAKQDFRTLGDGARNGDALLVTAGKL